MTELSQMDSGEFTPTERYPQLLAVSDPAEEVLDSLMLRTLDEINYVAGLLYRDLLEVEKNTLTALASIEEGARLSGMSGGQGPLGIQTPADIIRYTSQLDGLFKTANRLGITQERISAAYTQASTR